MVFIITLILSLSSAVLNNLHTKIKTIYWSVLKNSYCHIVHSIYMAHALLIRQSGDIEMNPGLRPNHCHSLSICHWKLNDLTPHN